MKILKLVLAIILALLMLFGASGHITNPEISAGFIPDFLPEQLVHILAIIVEVALGILTLIPKTRKYGLTGIFLLMIAYLPLHIMDVFRENPVLGTKNAAIIRLIVQFVVIFLAWFANKPSKLS